LQNDATSRASERNVDKGIVLMKNVACLSIDLLANAENGSVGVKNLRDLLLDECVRRRDEQCIYPATNLQE